MDLIHNESRKRLGKMAFWPIRGYGMYSATLRGALFWKFGAATAAAVARLVVMTMTIYWFSTGDHDDILV